MTAADCNRLARLAYDEGLAAARRDLANRPLVLIPSAGYNPEEDTMTTSPPRGLLHQSTDQRGLAPHELVARSAFCGFVLGAIAVLLVWQPWA